MTGQTEMSVKFFPSLLSHLLSLNLEPSQRTPESHPSLPSLSPALGSQSQTKTVGYFSVGAGVQTQIFIFPWQEREAI